MRTVCRAGVLILPLLAMSAIQARTQAQAQDDEAFKKAFLGSYGVHPDVEPRIGPEDRAVLEQVYPLLNADPGRAAQLLAEAKAKAKEPSAIFDFVLGNLAIEADRTDDAERHFRDAVTRFPAFRRAWRNLGLIQAREARYDEAIASFTKLIELGGGDAISLGLLATAYLSKQDYLAAETAFRQALLYEPENAQWRIGLARSVLKQEKYEEAVALLSVLLEREPERSEFWLLQANAFLGMQQPLRAAENLEMVALLGQAKPESFTLLGDIYLEQGMLDAALGAYVRCIESDPAQPVGPVLRAAEQLASRGAMTQAGAVASHIRSSLGAPSPEEEQGMAKLEARVALASGAEEDAVQLLESIVERDPLDGEALLMLGRHLADSGDADRALVYLERAAGIDGFEAQAKLREAQIHVSSAKYDEAVALLRRVQEIQPREQVARYLEQVERLSRTRN
jgi:tetratricopeptide (TPR) repeat protein